MLFFLKVNMCIPCFRVPLRSDLRGNQRFSPKGPHIAILNPRTPGPSRNLKETTNNPKQQTMWLRHLLARAVLKHVAPGPTKIHYVQQHFVHLGYKSWQIRSEPAKVSSEPSDWGGAFGLLRQETKSRRAWPKRGPKRISVASPKWLHFECSQITFWRWE